MEGGHLAPGRQGYDPINADKEALLVGRNCADIASGGCLIFQAHGSVWWPPILG